MKLPPIVPNAKQKMALANQAELLIFGGAAGSSKSYYLFLEGVRHKKVPGFVASYFRRTMADITVDGGAWQKSLLFMPRFGGVPNHSNHSYLFPSGARFGFANLEHEWSVEKYQSAEIPLELMDEANQFSKHQLLYMRSRNRTDCGVRPITRWTCNPDPDCYVKEVILPWLDEEGRFPNPEMAGVIRWMVFEPQTDRIVWWDDEPKLFKEILAINRYEDENYKPISVAFLPASVDDNPHMIRAGYKSTLMNLTHVNRQRLLHGDWLIKPTAGEVFKRHWFGISHRMPKDSEIVSMIRYWDLAATKKKRKANSRSENDPDYTVGVLLAKLRNGTYMIIDVKRERDVPAEIEQLIRRTAEQDRSMYGGLVRIGIEVDVGQAGISQGDYYIRLLSAFSVKAYSTDGKSKLQRAEPVSSQAFHGNIFMLYSPWNEVVLLELEMFPDGTHDDIVDSISGGYAAIQSIGPNFGSNWL